MGKSCEGAVDPAWERTREEFLRDGDAERVFAWRSAAVDQIVLDAGREFLGAVSCSLLAVGGYGRRQLFPYSDIDLLLLFDSDRAADGSKKLIAPFLQRLWDSGLRVSQSVRTVSECTELHEQNVELNVSLLDARFLIGDEHLAAKLNQKLPRFIHGQAQHLTRNLSRLTRERHLKFGDTFYHLEPNVKETPGGIRDFQLLCWLAQVKSNDGSRLASAPAIPELEAARAFFFAVRCHLHYQNGRDANGLSFDAQESLAQVWGGAAAAGTAAADTAAWMRQYFRHARDIYRSAIRLLESAEARSSSLFSQFRDRMSRLSNADFSVLRERVFFRTPQQLAQEPALALRLFEFIARHGIRLSYDAEQRIQASLPAVRAYLEASQPLWPAVKQMLSLPHAGVALRAMHETGVLRELFPEQAEIECLVIRDFYHRYTVDEHTLVTIQTLLDLSRSKEPSAKPYAELLSELEQPALLYFSLLFHDVGKGDPNEGHVDASVRVAEGAMERIGVPEPERAVVRFLIGRHLDLSATMNSRDLEESSTIEAVAERMGTVERLKALTLLTYADISAVNPAAMTPWRAAQLFRLYLLTYNALTRELETERISTRPTDSAEKAAFLEGFPTRYLRTHTEKEVDAHFAMREPLASKGVAVNLERVEGAWRLTLLTTDRPFLFASIAGTLSSFGMNILKAEAFANRRAHVLDTFVFADPSRTLELNPTEAERLSNMIERVVLGRSDVRELLKNRPKAAAPSRGAELAPSISFDGDASPSATLIQIVAQDRPGLLYDVARTMSATGCNIEVVLIDTEAHKAIDVFYVTADGAKLDGERQARLRAELLGVCST